MRVAVVTETWAPSVDGVVVRLRNTVRELLAQGHQVLVVAPTTGADLTGLEEYRTHSARLRFLYGGRPWALPDPRVLRRLQRFGPDVVHVVNPVLMGSLAAWLARSRYPVVASFHTDVLAYAGHYHLGWLRGPLRAVMRRTYQGAAVRLATSRLGRDRLAEVGVDEIALWSRGVDRQLFRPDRDGSAMRARLNPNPTEPLVLYVGRLAAEKGCDRLLPLASCDPPVHLAFVGDGPDRERLERLFGHEHATFAGFLAGEDLADAYAAADVLVFPSTTDTLGLVLLEAMACDVPVVAADTAATRETLAGYPAHALVDTDTESAMRRGVRDAVARHRAEPARPALGPQVSDWRQATAELVDAYTRAAQSPPARGSARGPARGPARAPGHGRRVSRFAVVGTINAAVDLAVFNLLFFLNPTRSSALLVAYNTCAVLAAITNSYLWNSRWTFRDRPRTDPPGRWRQRALFVIQGGINLAVNDLAVLGGSFLLIQVLGVRSALAANAAKALAMLTASAVSYLLLHYLVFPHRSPGTSTSRPDRAPADGGADRGTNGQRRNETDRQDETDATDESDHPVGNVDGRAEGRRPGSGATAREL